MTLTARQAQLSGSEVADPWKLVGLVLSSVEPVHPSELVVVAAVVPVSALGATRDADFEVVAVSVAGPVVGEH